MTLTVGSPRGSGEGEGGGVQISGPFAVAYQWASAAAFYDVATPSQVVGDPPLGPKAPQGCVGSLARCPHRWLRLRYQSAK